MLKVAEPKDTPRAFAGRPPACKTPSTVGGSHLAVWLKAEMEKQDHLTKTRLSSRTGLDRKTIQKMLDGIPVREVRVGKLADGLGVSRMDIPSD